MWDSHLYSGEFWAPSLAMIVCRCSFKSPVCLSIILHQSPTELPKMESKDLQQLFKDVLGSEREQHLGCGTPGLDGSRTPLQRPFLQGDMGGLKTGGQVWPGLPPGWATCSLSLILCLL